MLISAERLVFISHSSTLLFRAEEDNHACDPHAPLEHHFFCCLSAIAHQIKLNKWVLILFSFFPLSTAIMPIAQDKRVSMGLNGDLFFSNVLAKDANTDYSCNARFEFTHTIQQKNPYTLKVQTSE